MRYSGGDEQPARHLPYEAWTLSCDPRHPVPTASPRGTMARLRLRQRTAFSAPRSTLYQIALGLGRIWPMPSRCRGDGRRMSGDVHAIVDHLHHAADPESAAALTLRPSPRTGRASASQCVRRSTPPPDRNQAK